MIWILNERILLNVAAGILALAVSLYIVRGAPQRQYLLGLSTLLLTAALLTFYHFNVISPSHGVSILILPLATGWLWWRRARTGKPAISAPALALLQILYALLYVLIIWLQEG